MLGYHVSRPIYYKYIASLYSPLEPVHRVHSLVHAVRPSLLLSGGLAGMFPHVFAASLLLLSTFLRCYKLLEIERIEKRNKFNGLRIFMHQSPLVALRSGWAEPAPPRPRGPRVQEWPP